MLDSLSVCHMLCCCFSAMSINKLSNPFDGLIPRGYDSISRTVIGPTSGDVGAARAQTWCGRTKGERPAWINRGCWSSTWSFGRAGSFACGFGLLIQCIKTFEYCNVEMEVSIKPNSVLNSRSRVLRETVLEVKYGNRPSGSRDFPADKARDTSPSGQIRSS